MEALEDKRVRLQPECKKRLNDRIEMWSYAAKVSASASATRGLRCSCSLEACHPWLPQAWTHCLCTDPVCRPSQGQPLESESPKGRGAITRPPLSQHFFHDVGICV